MAKTVDLYERQRRLAWYLIVPAVLVVLLVIGFPLAQVVVYSFMKYKLDGVTPASFVGLDNYAFVFSDPDWWRAVWNTLVFSFFSVTLETVLGLAVPWWRMLLSREGRSSGSHFWFPGPSRRWSRRRSGSGCLTTSTVS